MKGLPLLRRVLCCFVLFPSALFVGLGLLVGSSLYDDVFLASGRFVVHLLNLPSAPNIDANETRYDYENIQDSWAAHPDVQDWADAVPPDSNLLDSQHQCKTSVFFVYPSGYFGMRLNSPAHPKFWRDPLGVVGDMIADVTGTVHAAMYNSVGKVFTPRYRQMTGWGFMLDRNDARREGALQVALDDIRQAFKHFLKVNQDRPFILAGHSQGSMILCKLIKQGFPDPVLAKNFIVAYLIGGDLSDGDCGPIVRQCDHPLQLGCFVHYNAFMDDGDRAKFLLAGEEKNLSCVNPISFYSDEKQVHKSLNPGSRPLLRPLQLMTSFFHRFVTGLHPVLNLMSPLEQGLFGARCSKGVVWIDRKDCPSGFWTTGLFPGKNLHGGESSLFFLSTRLNAEQRVARYFEQEPHV